MPDGLDRIRRDIEGTDLKEVGRSILGKSAALIGGTATTKYMRSGGTGASVRNSRRGEGTLRRRTGRLARSLTGARSAQLSPDVLRAAPEGIFDLSPTSTGVRLTYGSEVPYAAIHEYESGFASSVQMVSQHTRTMEEGFGPEENYPMEVTVRAHSRRMFMPKRPYLGPALEDQIDEVRSIAEGELVDAIFGGGDS